MTQQQEPSDKPAAPPAVPEGQLWTPAQQPNPGAHPAAFQPHPTRPHHGGYPPPYASALPPLGPTNGLGTVSLVIGILALLCSWVPFAGLAFGIVALTTAFAARRRVKRGQATNNRVAIAGMVLSALATVIGGAIALFFLVIIIDYQNCIGHAQGRYEYSRC